MLLRLGDKMMIADRMPGGQPMPGWGVSGWGIPSYGGQAPWVGGPMKPQPVGARYFCGDCDSVKTNVPVAQGNKYSSTKAAYQEAVTAHYAEAHADLHYPLDQGKLDTEARLAKEKAYKLHLGNQAEQLQLLRDLVAQGRAPVGGGLDVSSAYLAVKRPRELPDFTEFDFPDANVADAAVEEIELDQLISIAARQGRRFLGVELQGLEAELGVEYLTIASGTDLLMAVRFALNTRTGAHNLDDPENLWRFAHTVVSQTAAATENSSEQFLEIHNPPEGGAVYVAPRLFWRFNNELDRQVDIGDMFTRIATVSQPLSTFLLFELLEQFSGLFGLT